MKYFMVTCFRGHCGTRQSSDIRFAFEAKNLVEACNKARRMPSVKHSRFIVCGKEISKEEYLEYRKISAYERYPQGQRA